MAHRDPKGGQPVTHHAKAIVAFLTSVLGGFLIVITGNETFADVTVAEYLSVAASTVTNTAAVWLTPNGEING